MLRVIAVDSSWTFVVPWICHVESPCVYGKSTITATCCRFAVDWNVQRVCGKSHVRSLTFTASTWWHSYLEKRPSVVSRVAPPLCCGRDATLCSPSCQPHGRLPTGDAALSSPYCSASPAAWRAGWARAARRSGRNWCRPTAWLDCLSTSDTARKHVKKT